MADAYATLANGGIHHDPTAVSRVEFPDGKVDDFEKDSGERVLTPGQAYEVTRILEGVITQGTGAGYTYHGLATAQARRPARPAPRRNPTTWLSDAWFVGSAARFDGDTLLDRGLGRPPDHRANTPASAVPPPARSGSQLHVGSRRKATAPNSKQPDRPARTRRPRQRTHLLRPATSGYEEEETYEGEEEETKTKARAREKGGDDEAAEAKTPEPKPEPRLRHPSPAPAPPPRGRRQPRPRLIAPTPKFGSPIARTNLGVADATPRSARSGSRRGRGRSRCGGPRCGRRGGRGAFRARCPASARRSRVASRSSTTRAMWL